MLFADKVERALAAYLQSTLSHPGIPIRTARAGGPPLAAPYLLVALVDLDANPDLPADQGTFDVTLRLDLAQPSSSGAALHASDLQIQLESLLWDTAALQSSVNRPLTGADTRVVAGLHLHNLLLTGRDPHVDPSSHALILSLHLTATLTNADQ